jgi:hypothetical protein
MRFRDERPGDLDRARAAVAAWRDSHPAGTADDLVAAVGPAFCPEWAVVLRGELFAVDRHRARAITACRVAADSDLVRVDPLQLLCLIGGELDKPEVS